MTVEGFVGAIDAAVPCAQILDLARALTPYIYRKNKKRINCDMQTRPVLTSFKTVEKI